MAAMGELQFILQDYAAMEQRLSDPFSVNTTPSERGSTSTPLGSPTGSQFLAGSPPASSPLRRGSIPLWEKRLSKKAEILEEQRLEVAEKLKIRKPTRRFTSLRSYDF
jgi:hypothetical protein